MKKCMKKGFTLTELIVVIAIIAILAAVLIPTSVVFINRAKESSDMQEAMGAHKSYLAQVAPDLDKAEVVYGCSYKLGGFYVWENDVLQDEKIDSLPNFNTKIDGVNQIAIVILNNSREYIGYALYNWDGVKYEKDPSCTADDPTGYTDRNTTSSYIKLQ